MKQKYLVMMVLIVLTSIMTYGQNENPQAIKAMKKAIGSVINKYTTYSTPTNNFGVGTSCLKKWVPKGTMICDMVKCFGLDRNNQNTDAWKSVNGFAFYGEPGPLTLEDSLNRDYGLGVMLPKVLKALSINMDMNISRIRSVKLTIDSAALRYLDYNKYKEYATSNKNKTLQTAWTNGTLLVITSDYVLLDYSLEVNPVDSFGVTLAAKLDSMGIAGSKLFNGNDSLGVKIERRSGGSFKLTSNKPVVFAVLIKKKKNIEGQGAENSFDKWDAVTTTETLALPVKKL